MVADIRKEFVDILKNVDWMDEKTRQNALEKAQSMSTHIAYPDELLDNKKLEEFFDGVNEHKILFVTIYINSDDIFYSWKLRKAYTCVPY